MELVVTELDNADEGSGIELLGNVCPLRNWKYTIYLSCSF
jgi:hypothetical protein